jgi:hypothetical protein
VRLNILNLVQIVDLIIGDNKKSTDYANFFSSIRLSIFSDNFLKSTAFYFLFVLRPDNNHNASVVQMPIRYHQFSVRYTAEFALSRWSLIHYEN